MSEVQLQFLLLWDQCLEIVKKVASLSRYTLTSHPYISATAVLLVYSNLCDTVAILYVRCGGTSSFHNCTGGMYVHMCFPTMFYILSSNWYP